MGKWVAAAVIGVVSVTVVVVPIVAVTAGSAPGPAPSSSSGPARPGSGGVAPGAAVPPAWLLLYQQAATTCPGLPWSVLAAVGTVETGSGQSRAPGVWSGANPAGAEGPMQFEPATFAAYATVGPDGVRPASPYDPIDAVYTAAALLCADGAGSAAALRSAIADYNQSDAYVNTVLALSLALDAEPGASGTVVAALTFAAQQLGTPYIWGGTGSGGFDCSGLAQAAYGAVGITLPRVAQLQFEAGPAVPSGVTVEPGDLVFFGYGPTDVQHVGLYVGAGLMIDAPHSGASVRFDDAHWSGLVGATRPR